MYYILSDTGCSYESERHSEGAQRLKNPPAEERR